MAYAPSAVADRDLPHSEGKSSVKAGKNFFRRFFEALQATRMRQADREIARYLELNGGKFTDEVEREIERRFL